MDKPVILASNHPTAFIESTMLACWLQRDMHFIVRGNLFVQPFYRKILLGLKMIPIYRKRDVQDYADLKKNFDTLDYCYDLLGRGDVINILAEGNTIQEKRLRPLQKGTARMAFGAIEKYGEDTDIYIVPTGVNFTQADQVRTDVMIEFGEPIRVADYLPTYRENKSRAIRNLTIDLRTHLEPRLIVIDEVADEEVTEHLFTIYRNNHLEKILPVTEHSVARLNNEKRTATYVNQLTDTDKTNLKTEVNAYFDQLQTHQLTDFGVRHACWYSLFNSFVLLIGLLPYLFGKVLNSPPLALAHFIRNTRVKQREFKSPVMMTVCMSGFLIYYILWLIAAFVVGNTNFWLFVLMMPLWGYLSILYKEFYIKWRSAKRFKALDKNLQDELIQQRTAIVNRNFWKEKLNETVQ